MGTSGQTIFLFSKELWVGAKTGRCGCRGGMGCSSRQVRQPREADRRLLVVTLYQPHASFCGRSTSSRTREWCWETRRSKRERVLDTCLRYSTPIKYLTLPVCSEGSYPLTCHTCSTVRRLRTYFSCSYKSLAICFSAVELTRNGSLSGFIASSLCCLAGPRALSSKTKNVFQKRQ